MAEKNPHSQLELFSQSQAPARKRNDIRSSFLGYVRSYEKAILLFICFMVSGIISFSLGVEKGKRLAVSRRDIRIELAARAPKPDSRENSHQVTVSKPPAPKPAPQIDKSGKSQNYTIQLASYQNTTYADKEARRLEKKGFTVSVMSKGSYSIVCVGNFANKEMARSLLSQLRKTYRDSFIRRL